jgi:hypothetical protein
MNGVIASMLAIGLLAAPVLATESAPKTAAPTPTKASDTTRVAHARQTKAATHGHKRHAHAAKPAAAPAPETK